MSIFLDKEKMVNDARNWLANNYSKEIPEEHICAIAQAFYSCGYLDETLNQVDSVCANCGTEPTFKSNKHCNSCGATLIKLEQEINLEENATAIHIPIHENGSIGCGDACKQCGGNSLSCGCY